MHTGNTGPLQALRVGGAGLAALAKVGRVVYDLVIEERGIGKSCGPPEHLAFCRSKAQRVKSLAIAVMLPVASTEVNALQELLNKTPGL